MEKIPVGRSIAGAYGFLFGRFFTILGLSWLPAAMLAGGRLAFLNYAGPDMLTAMRGGHLPMQTHLLHFGFFLFSLLMISIVTLSLSREALGLRGERVAAHLVVGAREIRLFLAFLRLIALMVLVLAVLVLAVTGICMGTDAALAMWAKGTVLEQYPVAHVVKALAILVAVGVAMFVSLRMKFLIAPIAAAEDHARLMRAWSLSAGNFWRMVVVSLAAILPFLIVTVIVEYTLAGPQLHALGQEALSRGQRADPALLYQLMMVHAPLLVSIAAAGLVILIALFAGASAVAYRALVPVSQPEAPAEPRPEPQARIEPTMHNEPHTLAEPEIVSAPEVHAEEPAQDVVVEETHETHAIEEPVAPAEEPVAEAAHEPAPETHAAEPEGHVHHGVYTADEVIEAPLELVVEEGAAEAHEQVLAEEHADHAPATEATDESRTPEH